MGAWLLFFPNAPYVLTDLIHLDGKQSPLVPEWYDLAMILSVALTGLIIGFLSLERVQGYIAQRTGVPWSWCFVVVVMFLSGFGIYLGRFLRWNSWDILTRPLPLLSDVADRFLHPFDHPRTMVVTFLFGIFLTLGLSGFPVRGRADRPEARVRRPHLRPAGDGGAQLLLFSMACWGDTLNAHAQIFSCSLRLRAGDHAS